MLGWLGYDPAQARRVPGCCRGLRSRHRRAVRRLGRCDDVRNRRDRPLGAFLYRKSCLSHSRANGARTSAGVTLAFCRSVVGWVLQGTLPRRCDRGNRDLLPALEHPKAVVTASHYAWPSKAPPVYHAHKVRKRWSVSSERTGVPGDARGIVPTLDAACDRSAHHAQRWRIRDRNHPCRDRDPCTIRADVRRGNRGDECRTARLCHALRRHRGVLDGQPRPVRTSPARRSTADGNRARHALSDGTDPRIGSRLRSRRRCARWRIPVLRVAHGAQRDAQYSALGSMRASGPASCPGRFHGTIA